MPQIILISFLKKVTKMKLNNFFVLLYGLVMFCCLFVSYKFYNKSKEMAERTKEAEYNCSLAYTQTQLLTVKINEMDSYIKFMEQSIPDIQKRNAKAKIVKEIVDQAIKNTKQNHFKSDREYNDYILSVVDYSDKYRVPTSLILAVSRTESNFNPRAVSPTNAQGIMQLIPSTSKYCATSLKKEQHDPFYARDSVQCGTWYLRQMLDIFQDENLVIQAYNVGPSYILKFKGQDLPTETKDYHERVTGFLAEYRPKFKWEN